MAAEPQPLLAILKHDDTVTVTVNGAIVWIGSLSDWSRALVGNLVKAAPKVA